MTILLMAFLQRSAPVTDSLHQNDRIRRSTHFKGEGLVAFVYNDAMALHPIAGVDVYVNRQYIGRCRLYLILGNPDSSRPRSS